MDFFKRALGHAFQEEGKTFGQPGNQGAPVARDISKRAVSTYGGGVDASFALKSDPVYRTLQGKATFIQSFFNYTVVYQLVLPAAERIYLIIQNLDLIADMYIGFDVLPAQAAFLGLKILAGGNYEPLKFPSNDIYLSGSANGRAMIIYAIG